MKTKAIGARVWKKYGKIKKMAGRKEIYKKNTSRCQTFVNFANFLRENRRVNQPFCCETPR